MASLYTRIQSVPLFAGASYLRGPGEICEGLWVRDEHQAAAAAVHHVLDVCLQLSRQVAQNGEGDEADEQWINDAQNADDPCVSAGGYFTYLRIVIVIIIIITDCY